MVPSPSPGNPPPVDEFSPGEETITKDVSSDISIKRHPLFRWITLASAILTWPLISFGTYVRLKNAGMSCPDWPLCHGQIIPPAGFEIALEVGHRFVASLLGLFITILLILSYSKPLYKNYRFLSAWIFVLVCIQGILGGLTVLMRLSPPTVVFHLVGGNVLFGLLIFLAYRAYYDEHHPNSLPNRQWSNLSKQQAGMLLLFFVILISGGANSSTYSGYACAAFPGCHEGSVFSFHVGEAVAEGAFLPKFQNEWIHMTHRLIAVAGGLTMLVLSWRTLYNHSNKTYRMIGIWICILILGEISIGILNALYRIPASISTAHTAIAATIVGLLSYSFAKSVHEHY
ncbi:MAG: COX15/CtaA family protein [SAR324 cluster bacterium]|nr:COX15/CtaA family protein [SAR324 cluster bacterium]